MPTAAPRHVNAQRATNAPARHDPSPRLSASRRGYDRRWQRARAAYLAEHPLCVKHRERGRLVSATVVDHKVPHRGDMDLFWDEDNWQSMCKTCHDVKTATEDGGFGRAPKKGKGRTSRDGTPCAADHPWNVAG